MKALLRGRRGYLAFMASLAAPCMGLSFAAWADPPPAASSNTVIGPNAMLADGAAELMNRNWERGIQLTQMGLTGTVSTEDRAAGYANLCAGYSALKKYERALENCDQSVAIAPNNWKAWQNRAAANLGLGRIEESLRDIERGLAINPDSPELQKTLAIARALEKLQQERMDHLLES
jgi:tetratricopeptide (TPR) repeat protein